MLINDTRFVELKEIGKSRRLGVDVCSNGLDNNRFAEDTFVDSAVIVLDTRIERTRYRCQTEGSERIE